ncbi:MAG: hypothetical protein D6725_05145 [Planctomycetota bacterium]|nr:MAG: hypothetical protein D6725_05145 [Planctomycetota bacterium]
MNPYSSLADDVYTSMSLNTEMPLPGSRESVLSFFERIQKTFPTMRNFYTRDTGDLVLEEDKDSGQQRWVTLEARRISSAHFNPGSVGEAMRLHELVLDVAPYMLSLSPLDCEALDYVMGFDFLYAGNHDQLVAEALELPTSFAPLLDVAGSRVLNYEPAITIGLDESCRLQARLMIETRTTAYQVRRGSFPEDPISVYFSVRQYGSIDKDVGFVATIRQLRERCEELLDEFVVGQVLRPLAQAISAG